VDFASQNEYITKNIKKIIAQGTVKALYIYELFDQPSLAQRYQLKHIMALSLEMPQAIMSKKMLTRASKVYTKVVLFLCVKFSIKNIILEVTMNYLFQQ